MSFRRLLESLGHDKNEIHNSEQQSDNTDNTETLRLSDDIELTVQGLPPDLPPEHKTNILFGIARNVLVRLPDRDYQEGENMYQGTANVRVNDRAYKVSFSVDAIKMLTALAVYKKAFDAVNEGAESGIYDRELAKATAEFIKQSARQEVDEFKNHKAELASEKSQPSSSNNNQLQTNLPPKGGQDGRNS